MKKIYEMEKEPHLAKYFVVPQRYVMAIMGFLAIVNAYTMRVSLSIAITEMVAPMNETDYYDPDACPADNSSSPNTITDPDQLYNWDEKTQGLILSSFYWGYILTHVPGGILAERFGGKYTLGLGVLSTALITLITPFVIHISDGNPWLLIMLRVIGGLGEGTTYPALNVLLAKWIPISERATMGTLVYSGSQMGTVFSNLVSGGLIKATEDWASVFYLFGGIGVMWVMLWFILCYNDPDSHPFISAAEKRFLDKELESVSKERNDIPWKAILTSVPVWALVVAQIGHDWSFFTMVTDLPKYMKDVLKFRVEENGVWSSVPYVVMWSVSMIAAWICDRIIQSNRWSTTFTRKFFTTLAKLGSGIFIIAASYSGCDRMLAVWMFTIAMGFMGCFYCGMKVNALDLSSNYAGTVMAIVNGIGAITGMIAPYLAGAIAVDHTLAQWRTVFWVTFAIVFIANIFYMFFGSGEVQEWDKVQVQKTDEKKPSKLKMNV